MTPERLAEIRSLNDAGYQLIWPERHELLAEVDRLLALVERQERSLSAFSTADLSLNRKYDAVCDEVDRLRAQVLNLNRWVERVNAKRITPEAIERGARFLYASRYFGDEDYADEETARIYREKSEGCLRAALASGDADD